MVDQFRNKLNKIYRRTPQKNKLHIEPRIAPSKIEAIIPFFGGVSIDQFHGGNLGPGHTDIRLRYLSRTIDSVTFVNNVYVFVRSDEDQDAVMKLNKKIVLIKVTSMPLYLPATALEYIQKNHHNGVQYYYYTESDQVVHFKNLSWLLSVCDDNNYIAPHRWEEIRDGKIYDPIMRFKDKNFFVNNTSPFHEWGKPPLYEQVGEFVKCNDAGKAYAGAYLCSSSLLLKIKFSRSGYLSLEHSSGFDVFNTARALKTFSFDVFLFNICGFINSI